MNICFLSYRENNPYIGGIEKTTYILGRELKQRGYEILFLSQINSHSYKTYEPLCKELFFPDYNNIDSEINCKFLKETIEHNNINVIINQYSTTKGFNTLCQQIRQQNPDIKIISPLHLDPAYKIKEITENFFIKDKNGTSLQSWCRNLFLYIRFKALGHRKLLNNAREELAYIENCSDKVVLLSSHTLNDIKKIYESYKPHKYCAIGNPIEHTSNKNKVAKKKQILYVGRIEFGLKRFDRALNIWSRIEKKNPEWQFIVLGDGDYRILIEQIAIKRGLERIRFEGFKDPIPYYKDAEIICLTSSSEGFANVLVEAQNYGCLPIAFDSYSALKDIIQDGHNGYVIPPFKNTIFANKVQELINDPTTRVKMQNNARIHSEKFDVKLIADQWEKLFEELAIKE